MAEPCGVDGRHKAGHDGAGGSINRYRLSHDFLRWSGEKEPLGEGGSPLGSGEGRIGVTLTV
jgi:hypothetical protein